MKYARRPEFLASTQTGSASSAGRNPLLYQTEGAGRRLILARIASAGLVQTKGFVVIMLSDVAD